MKEYINIRLTEEFINFICKKPHGREAIEEYLIGLHDSIIEDISKWSETMLVSAVIDTADPANDISQNCYLQALYLKNPEMAAELQDMVESGTIPDL